MKKSTVRNVAIASSVATLAVLAAGIANPTALVPTSHHITRQVHHTGKLAAPSAQRISLSVNDTSHNHNQFGFANFSADVAYPGQPILLTLGTIFPTAKVDASGASTKAVRPIFDQFLTANYTTTITRFRASHNAPQLTNSSGHIAVGYWQLSYSQPGKHTVTVHLGGGHVKTAAVTVVPMTAKYTDVHYQGVAESTGMTLGIDPSAEQPAHWPWSFTVRIDTTHTHYSHNIALVRSKWSVPFTIHADTRGEIVEALTTTHYPTSGTMTGPMTTFAPTQAATPNYTATYDVSTSAVVHGTAPVRFWAYWLGEHPQVQSWTWQPTLYAEWEWLALAGLLAAGSLLGGINRRKRKG